ncbi:MAG: NADH-quinone oxidoreductase subunit NuoK [Chloroflexi bacterium]|nr:NADH-quinone oxidoreductase subunit NuoK [Chloroflexota bacterium]
MGLPHYLGFGAVLFCIGLYGALSRRNAVAVLMSVEIMLNAVNVTFVALSAYVAPVAASGQVFALFVMTVAAAEVAVGLAIILSVYRQRATVDVERLDSMRG